MNEVLRLGLQQLPPRPTTAHTQEEAGPRPPATQEKVLALRGLGHCSLDGSLGLPVRVCMWVTEPTWVWGCECARTKSMKLGWVGSPGDNEVRSQWPRLTT